MEDSSYTACVPENNSAEKAGVTAPATTSDV